MPKPLHSLLRSFWPVAVTFGLGILVSALLWQALEQQERQHVQLALDAELIKVREKLEAHLETRLLALTRMAARWEVRPPSREEWESEAALLVQHLRGFQAVEWADGSHHVRWVYPLHGNQSAVNLSLLEDPRRREPLLESKQRQEALVTRTLELAQRGRGFLAYVPIFQRSDQTFDGFILGVFQVQDSTETILGPDLTRFSVRIYDGGELVYSSASGPFPGESPEGKTRLTLRGLDWDIHIRLLPSRVEELHSNLPAIALAAGLVMTALICVAITLTLVSRAKAKVLRSTNALQRAILDGSTYAIISYGADGTVQTFNAGAQALLGYSADEVVGRVNVNQLHHPEEMSRRAKQLSSEFRRLVLPGVDAITAGAQALGHDEREWTFVRKSGAALPVQLSVTPIRDADGQVSSYLSIGFDITRRKEDEERFRVLFEEVGRARSQLMDAIESLDAGFVMYDADDRLVVCNKKFREIYALVSDVLLPGTRFERIIRSYTERGGHLATGLSAESFTERRLALQRTGNGEPFEERLADRWIRVNDHRTEDGGVVSLRTDITSIKRAQEELRVAKEAAEEGARAKSEFLARMSHEIRTPMNGVLGMTELALRTHLTSEQREYLETARGSARSLLGIINDLLDFSKMEAGQLQLEQLPMRVRDGLGEMLKALSVRAYEKGLDLMFAVEPDVPDRLLGDEQRVRQVVTNLVSNAVKFTERGEILVTASLESKTDDHATIHFAVADAGIGIAAAKQAVIFDAFAQADTATSRKYGGTGLGLAICRQLVSLMGGRIWVESEEGLGSRFHFTATFPLDKSESPLPTPPTLSSAPSLIVDDSAAHRLILQELLAGWRMAPRALPDPDRAYEALAQAVDVDAPISVVIINADLPDNGARKLLTRMSEHPQLAATPIVWLAAAGSPTPDRIPSRWIRLNKPVIPSPLFEALQQLVMGVSPTDSAGGASESSLATSPVRRLKVLVADDNAVNRQVARRLLELEGHEVVAVEDGRAAVAAVAQEPFDAVLMDVQMPELDGYGATGAIRAMERGTSRHLPILAVTAQAMKGDDERCLAAGMDGYFSKPIDPAALAQALSRVAAGLPPCGNDAGAPRPILRRTSLDEPTLLKQVGGSRELLQEVIQLFREDAPTMLSQVQESVRTQNAEALEKSAHKLKGALLSLAATPAATRAKELEEMGRELDLSQCARALQSLELELSHLTAALNDFSTRV